MNPLAKRLLQSRDAELLDALSSLSFQMCKARKFFLIKKNLFSPIVILTSIGVYGI